MCYWTSPIHALPNTYDWGVLSQLCVAQGLVLVCVLCCGVAYIFMSRSWSHVLMFRHCMLYIDKFYSILTQVLSLLAVLTIWAIVAHCKYHGTYGCVC